jgi:hypothetical protein
MWLDWQSKYRRCCSKRGLTRTIITSSCEEERAAHRVGEEERVGLLEVSAEDPGSASLKVGCPELYHESGYRYECGFEISWM